jgi:hypothetical protein
VETVSSVLLAPGRFFARLRTGTDTYKAWLFALTLGSLGAVGAFAWETAFGPTALGSGGHEFDSPAVRLILTPVIITLRLGIVALLCHFMLYATNQRKARLSMSFAAACYAGGAAAVLRVLPLAGETISALVFGLVLIPALAGVHRSRPARVVAGLLLPLLLVAALFAAALAGGATAGLLIHQALKETLAMLR